MKHWKQAKRTNTYTINEGSVWFNRNNTKYDFESFYPGANTLKANESESKLLGSDLHVLEEEIGKVIFFNPFCKGAAKEGKKI